MQGKKRIVWFVLLAMLTSMIPANAYASDNPPPGGNVIVNPDFSNGTEGWWTDDSKFKVSTEPDGWAKMTIVNPGSDGWDVVLQQPSGAIKGGILYTMSFDVKADAPRDFSACFYGSTDVLQCTPWPFSIDTAPQHVAINFTPPQDASQTFLKFPLGGNSTSVYLRNLYVGPSTAQPDLSHNADLADLKADGTTVDGFMAAKTDYDIALPADTAVPPVVSATVDDSHASMKVNQAMSVPGTASVTVTAEDGVTTKTYQIHFTSPNTSNPILLEDRFDNQSAGAFPSGWHDDYGNNSVTASVYGSAEASVYNNDDPANHTMKSLHNGWESNGISKTFDAQTGRLTLEYKFMDTRKGTGSVIGFKDSETGREALNISNFFWLNYGIKGEDAGSVQGPLQEYIPNTWLTVKIDADIERQSYDVYVNGEKKITDAPFLNSVAQLDTVFIRHLSYASSDQQSNEDMKGAETYVDDVVVTKLPASGYHAFSIKNAAITDNPGKLPALPVNLKAVKVTATFTNDAPHDQAGVLVIAQYDAAGKMLKAAYAPLTAHSGTSTDMAAVFTERADGSTPFAYKAFVWDSKDVKRLLSATATITPDPTAGQSKPEEAK